MELLIPIVINNISNRENVLKTLFACTSEILYMNVGTDMEMYAMKIERLFADNLKYDFSIEVLVFNVLSGVYDRYIFVRIDGELIKKKEELVFRKTDEYLEFLKLVETQTPDDYEMYAYISIKNQSAEIVLNSADVRLVTTLTLENTNSIEMCNVANKLFEIE